MRYDVFIEDCNKFNSYKNELKKRLKNVNISSFLKFEEIQDDILFADVLIFHIDSFENFLEVKNNIQKSCSIIIISPNKNDNLKLELFGFKYYLLNEAFTENRIFLKIKNILKKDKLLNLFGSNKNFSNTIINSINYPIFSVKSNRIIFSNNYFFELTNTKTIEELNLKYEDLTTLFEEEIDCVNIFSLIKSNSKVCIKNSNNEKKLFTIQKINLSNADTFIVVLNDISYEEKHKKELLSLLYNDTLTALPNRTKLIEDLQNSSLKIEAVALLNINSFKEVNDFFGHKVGDTILKDIAKIIQKKILKLDFIDFYKFPADNYCIVSTNKNRDIFIDLISKILKKIDSNTFIFEHYEIDIRMSSGISFSDKNNKLITADIALENAKTSFKDFVVFYDELDKFQEYENNMLWTRKLKSAFINDNIEVFFQPLINNKTLKVDKYECLVRLLDDGKIVSPYFFLDISKKSNQYAKLTKTVIEKSVIKFSTLPYDFSVNISYQDIENSDFLPFIKELLAKYHVANRIIFEILEDENVKSYDLLTSFISEVKALGCKIAIDDFGSGYSNFEYLLKMKADYLKIDASIIKNVATNENSYKITKTIIEFAKNLNLKTIAEFVENEEIFNIVRDLGVDYSQGYFFSAPLKEPSYDDFSI